MTWSYHLHTDTGCIRQCISGNSTIGLNIPQAHDFILPQSLLFSLWYIFVFFPSVTSSAIPVPVAVGIHLTSLCQSGHGLVNQSWQVDPEKKSARSICERFSSVTNGDIQEETRPLLYWMWSCLPANDIWNTYVHLATNTEEINNVLRMAEYKNENHLGPPWHCWAA